MSVAIHVLPLKTPAPAALGFSELPLYDRLSHFSHHLQKHTSKPECYFWYVKPKYKHLFTPMVAHLQRHDKQLRCLSALERLSLQKEYEAEYGVDGERDTYWHHIKLLTAFDIQALVCDMLSKAQKSCVAMTFDTDLPKSRNCMCCGQNVDRTCGCWFTDDGDTIVPYIVMPKAVAEEIKQTQFSSMNDLEIRLQQPDVIQTGTAFLNKRKYEQMDKEIRSLWANMVPKIASYMMQKTGADELQQLIRELHHLILEYNAPQQCASLSPTEVAMKADLFVLEDLLQKDEAPPKAVYKAPAPIVKRPKVVTAPKPTPAPKKSSTTIPKPSPPPTPQTIRELSVNELENLSRKWKEFDYEVIVEYVAVWNTLKERLTELRRLKKSPGLYGELDGVAATDMPSQIILEINRHVANNDMNALENMIARLRSRDLIPFSVAVQEEIDEEKAKQARWIEAERNVDGLVEALEDWTDENNTPYASSSALKQLYNEFILPRLTDARNDEQTMQLAYLMGIYKSDRLVAPVWQDDVWINPMRRKSYTEAMWKFMRYLLTNDPETYEEAWTAVQNAKLKLSPLRGFDKKGNSGEGVTVVKQNKTVDAGEITEAANFKWASSGGGSCAFDALFNGLFKMPNTWLQKKIFAAENVVPFNNQKCASDMFHASVVADILFLQGNEIARQECQSRNVYYECIGIPVETDDPQYVMSRLLAFYNLQDNVYVFSSGNYKLSTVPGKQLQVLQRNIGIPQNEQYEMFLFEVEDPLAPLQQRASVDFTIPNEIVMNNTPASSMHLMTCFVTTGGHWLAYVRDINTRIWWKFDAIADPPFDKYDENTPAAVLGKADFEKPAAYLYVRKQQQRPRQPDANIELNIIVNRIRVHKQQAYQDLKDMLQFKDKVSSDTYERARQALDQEKEKLPNWWQLEGSSTATIERFRDDKEYIKSLGLENIDVRYVLQVPQAVVGELPTDVLQFIVFKVMKKENVDESANRSLLSFLISTEGTRLGIVRSALFETIEHRTNLIHEIDLMEPLRLQIETHWPVISKNTVWMPVFEHLQLHPDMNVKEERSVENMHHLAIISRLLSHMDEGEPVPKDLYETAQNRILSNVKL